MDDGVRTFALYPLGMVIKRHLRARGLDVDDDSLYDVLYSEVYKRTGTATGPDTTVPSSMTDEIMRAVGDVLRHRRANKKRAVKRPLSKRKVKRR